MRLQQSDILKEFTVGREFPFQVTIPIDWVKANHVREGNEMILYRKTIQGEDMIVLRKKPK